MTTARPGRLPDFLIVGAMKAGTTSLAAWLRAHPGVYVPAAKELHFFDHFWDRGTDWYRAQFADAPDDAIAGEASPAYMVRDVYVERMAAVVPDVRLIVVLRNPAERAWSQYRHMVARGDETRSFEEVIASELAADPADWRTSGGCVARGRYIEHLRTLGEHYERSRIHAGLFERLASEPHAFFADVCRFLGIDDGSTPEEVGTVSDPFETDPKITTQRAAALTATGTLQRVAQRVGLRRRAAANRPTAAMPAAVRDRLVAYFRPYNEELARWLATDLSRWNV